MIRVFVVDDSSFVCQLMADHLRSAPDMEVAGTARGGRRALELIKEMRPDVVTLDLEMPEMSGLETLERIMHECPVPVVLVSGVSRRAAQATFDGINLGAIDFILKYAPGMDTDPDSLRQEITSKVRAAARVKIVRSIRSRRAPDVQEPSIKTTPVAVASTVQRNGKRASEFDARLFSDGVVIIGASTGGPLALRDLLGSLPADFPLGILIVQHMPAAFTPVLAAQLNRQVALHVREAQEGDYITPGVALVAPGDNHLRLNAGGRVRLDKQPPVAGHRPSIDVTMGAAAAVYGTRTHAVVLTGMGSDGVQGLAVVKYKGGKTYAQDGPSCVINGMPQRAIEKGVVDHIAPPTHIAKLLRLDCKQTLLLHSTHC